MKDTLEQPKLDEENSSSPSISDEQAKVNTRRNFIKKYGALAAITPVAMSMTMHSKKALAFSCTECAP